ncbi:MAG TPA: exo-alpha-sialidase [Planctomycetota bacterium]|jgi:hypothetical protein|nr:exo-alpha-sialidase [Planctomycetota bacterium]OQC20620.1 MAG: hypothetical protein BWX69_01650 [Planctomycetes bacterium ADurb.Bin069]HNR98744.1 exo-alpha-sialidase [Planctomycetota bacterium]HNU25452.1 exo-alpha-sialidase [Planctomycetota bacterium]HOE30424.1 exo-alpha-sialidase [Planctomycetota bacterium]
MTKVCPLLSAAAAVLFQAGLTSAAGAPHKVISRGAAAGSYQAFTDVCRLASGDLLCVFYAGYAHVSLPKDDCPKGGRICMTRSSDEGWTWSPPAVLFDGPHDDRDPHIAQMRDGTVLCSFFTYRPEAEAAARWDTCLVASRDGGATWETQARVVAPGWPSSAPVRELPDGTWVLGVYRPEGQTAYGGIIRSSDRGASWSAPIPIGKDSGVRLDAETDFVLRKDGTLYAALRGDRVNMHYATSPDLGLTWSPVKDIGFPGHCPHFTRLQTGEVLLTHRLPHTALHVSRDDCATWQGPYRIDAVIGAYASTVELRDGTVLVVYYEEGEGSAVRARRFRLTEGGIEFIDWEESPPRKLAASWPTLEKAAALPPGPEREEARPLLDALAAAPNAESVHARRAQLPELPAPGVVLHVAPGGHAGGEAAQPFTTLTQARDALRRLRDENGGRLPAGGARVVIHGGVYPVTETFVLEARDSGTAEAPVVYEAAPGETPVLTGGVAIAAWRPLVDQAVKDKLPPAVRDRIVVADLAELGVADLGDATDLRRAPELFVGGAPQTLARWPNDGFVATGAILGTDTFTVWGSIQGCKDGKFRYAEDRPSLWTDEPDVRLYGYWFWDWFEEFQKVASIDPAARAFTLARPYSVYGYRQGQRYYAVNVLRELDRPGEWYLERPRGLLYWCPPEGEEWRGAAAAVSVFAQPFIRMENVRHAILRGLAMEHGRGDGIHLRGGARCILAGCTVRRMGGDAIVVVGGAEHTVFGCTLHTLGCGGARVAGGDRKTFAPGGHLVENCTVRDISRLKRTYAPAVHLDGCGNRVAHNLFERIPSSALRVEGSEQTIELNLIRRVVEESDDQGGLDMYGNPLYRGVVIRWNRWSDIAGGTQCGAAGVRLDDMISGVVVHGNIFERCGAVQFGGVQIHGGKDNLVDNNVFLDCRAGLSFSRWGEKRWLEAIQKYLEEAVCPANAARYGELARLREGADVNFVTRNVFAGCKDVFLRDGGAARAAFNTVIEGSFDLGVVESREAIAADPRLAPLLFAPIPAGAIGPYAHPWRAEGSGE